MSLRKYIHFETGKVFEKLSSPFEDSLNYATEKGRWVFSDL